MGAALAGIAAWIWALLPIRTTAVPSDIPSTMASSNTSAVVEPLDFAAFDASAFHASADSVRALAAAMVVPPPVVPPTPLPPPALKFQLLGISKDRADFRDGSSTYRAVLYDPDTDRLYVVATGQQVLGHEVTRVSAIDVAIVNGDSIQTFTTRGDGRSSGANGSGS